MGLFDDVLAEARRRVPLPTYPTPLPMPKGSIAEPVRIHTDTPVFVSTVPTMGFRPPVVIPTPGGAPVVISTMKPCPWCKASPTGDAVLPSGVTIRTWECGTGVTRRGNERAVVQRSATCRKRAFGPTLR